MFYKIRYVGLDSIQRLMKIEQTHKLIKKKKHLKIIYENFNDDDMSISQRALQLLHYISDEDNVIEIVDHLFKYLEHNYSDCQNIVLIICIVVEKYYKIDFQWYVDVILKLLTTQSITNYIDDKIWHPLIEILSKDEDLQKYTVQKILRVLNSSTLKKSTIVINESIIKFAGYVLGEFGYLSENYSGEQQFDALLKYFYKVSDETKGCLLSTFMKFVNHYNDELQLLDNIVSIFQSCNSCVNLELQTRAVEYEMMITSHYHNQIVDGMMPDFPPQLTSNLHHSNN